jgi:hypothetical protein
MSSTIQTISRHLFDTATLVADFPPKFHHPNRKVVFEIARSADAEHQEAIQLWKQFLSSVTPASRLAEFIEFMDSRGFKWGVSDGN